MAAPKRARPARASSDAELVIGGPDTSLLDVVDNVLQKGVVLTGDLTIGLAQIDLIYAQVSVLLCAADRVLPAEPADLVVRHRRRHQRKRSV